MVCTKHRTAWRLVGWAALAATVAIPRLAAAQQSTAPVFTKDVAPILQDKCQACHRPGYIAPMSLVTYEETRPVGAVDQGAGRSATDAAVAHRQDRRHPALQERSLADRRSRSTPSCDGSMRARRRAIRRTCRRRRQFANDDVWNFASQFGGPPDLIIKSPDYTMPAQALDQWYKPVSRPVSPRRVGSARSKSVRRRSRAAESRTTRWRDCSRTTIPNRCRRPCTMAVGAGLFMEWAVGKQGEIMRAEQRQADAARLEDRLRNPLSRGRRSRSPITSSSASISIRKDRSRNIGRCSRRSSSIAGGARNIDIPPNATFVSQNFHVMRQAGRVENFQPHMHLRGKAMSMEAILPNGTTQMLSHVNNFNFNWHNNYVYADDAAPLLPKGTILQDHVVVRQHAPRTRTTRSESVGRLGRSHRRRDGPRVGEHHLHERRGLPGRTRTAEDSLSELRWRCQ